MVSLHRSIVIALGAIVFGAAPGAASWDLSTPLNQVPFVMTHDTATGYMGIIDGIYKNASLPEDRIIAWTKTQVGNLTKQLNCGARAFDMRPYVTADRQLLAHHGGIVVDYEFQKMMEELVDWAVEQPDEDELVLLEIVHCNGETDELRNECNDITAAVLDEVGIPYIFQNECPDAMLGMTLGDAIEKGKLKDDKGASVLAIYGACWQANYDPSRNCRGYEYETGISRKYSCFVHGTNPDYAVRNLFDYLDATAAQGPPANGMLWQFQALWQQTELTIALGSAEFSSILVDTLYSRINRYVFENITTGRWDGLNMVELDYVCDQGEYIALALHPDFNGTYEDYPDDVFIDRDGIVDNILNGDNVVFPDSPADYVGSIFDNNAVVRRYHNMARWGKTNDLVGFVQGDSSQKEEYLRGIFATAILLLCIFVVWAVVLLILKWTKKLGILAGIPPTRPTVVKTVDGAEDTAAVTNEIVKVERRMRRVRITVLVCGVALLILSGLVIGLGFKGIMDTLDSATSSIPSLRNIIEEANSAANDFLLQIDETRDARINYFNTLVSECTFDNEFVSNTTELLLELNSTLDGTPLLFDEITKISSSLSSITRDLSGLERTVEGMKSSPLFLVAIIFLCLFDVVVVVFMVGVILAWKKKQPRIFRDCTTIVALPLFTLLLLITYVVSLFALIAAVVNADLCHDSPDNQILRIVDAPPPFDELIEYYVRACDKSIRPELLFDAFKGIEVVILIVHGVLDEASQIDPSLFSCANATAVLGSMKVLQDEYDYYVELFYRLGEQLRCDNINPTYAGIAYQTACVNFFNLLRFIFISFLLIAVFSMTIVTLRVAWYELEDAADQDERALRQASQEVQNLEGAEQGEADNEEAPEKSLSEEEAEQGAPDDEGAPEKSPSEVSPADDSAEPEAVVDTQGDDSTNDLTGTVPG